MTNMFNFVLPLRQVHANIPTKVTWQYETETASPSGRN